MFGVFLGMFFFDFLVGFFLAFLFDFLVGFFFGFFGFFLDCITHQLINSNCITHQLLHQLDAEAQVKKCSGHYSVSLVELQE